MIAMKTVTVVIPNYNGKKYLDECFKSLKKQTYRDFHVIMVDNGSTDGSAEYIREKYPDIYAKVEERLETGWEQTIALMEQGIREGVIRPVNIGLVKMMFEASIEQFFSRDILVRNGIDYMDALNEVVDIIVDGITV